MEVLDLLIKMADKALYFAKSTVCTTCGFSSLNEDEFHDDCCPRCGGEAIIPGRNKIVTFGSVSST
jgi:predicted RNA-binding Zn-ribbon protein involved in translation (DUF1610 family)